MYPNYAVLDEDDDDMPEPVSEREYLLADLAAMRHLWRLPEIDGAPIQPTAEELPTWMQAWEAVGIVAATGTGQHRFAGLVAVIERHHYNRLVEIRARLVELDAAAEARQLGALARGLDRAMGVAA